MELFGADSCHQVWHTWLMLSGTPINMAILSDLDVALQASTGIRGVSAAHAETR